MFFNENVNAKKDKPYPICFVKIDRLCGFLVFYDDLLKFESRHICSANALTNAHLSI